MTDPRLLAPLLRLSVRWDIVLSLCCAIAAVGLAIILTGCATTGSIQAVVINDPSSGYDTGAGVSIDAATRGTLALATRGTATNARKHNSESGYTYSGAAGLRYGKRFFAEAGGIWYGYESRFDDGSTWAKDRHTPYAAVGMTLPRWQGVLRYYPSNGDNYDVTTVALESRHYFGRWLLTLEPELYRITLPDGERATETAIRAGVGWAWK